MADLQKVRIQLYDDNDTLIGDVDVMTSAEAVLFADGETFQDKLNSGKLKGEKGDTGAKGASGTAATIAVGTVTTGAAGSSVAITNAGTANSAVLNFTIPRGATGAAGAKGDIGATGPQGPKGDTGATGQRGSQAYAGTGITGTNTTATVFSNSGVTAALVNDIYFNVSTGNFYQCTIAGAASVAKWVYKGSFKGPKGDTGAQGIKGEKGDTGATGPQGPAGAKGSTGATGPAGAKGEKGDKGDAGDRIRVGTSFSTATQRSIFFKVVE